MSEEIRIEDRIKEISFMVGVIFLCVVYLTAQDMKSNNYQNQTVIHKYENAKWYGIESEEQKNDIEKMILFDYDIRETYVSCESDSMGLSIYCKNRIFYRTLTNNETLSPGDIYIYTKETDNGTKHIIHRLVLCLDDDCNNTIFKGDNNRVAEKVSRDQIKNKVIMQMY